MKKRKQPQGKAGRDDGRGPAHPKQLWALSVSVCVWLPVRVTVGLVIW